MLINNDFAPVTKSSNTMETNQASIAMTPHMFQILSAGIYQHPVRAVIRETSCNAYDAQVAAGNADKPFQVHLPTQLEPYYEVRDFGTGMTHEQVMKLYLTYGASTKRDSNDVIGGLGIGSKAPFAVAQSFTVTSYFDGVVRRYSIYMEEGVPQVTKLTESATAEANGVAVRVAIPLAKLDEFEAEANRIYTHFPVQPECNKVLKSIYANESILAEEKGAFRVYSGANHSNTIQMSIVMGNIEYPISLKEVVPNYDEVIPSFLRVNISRALIYLPIGSVNIAASRESLQLTDSTKQAIIDVFDKVAKKILVSFQEKIDTATNLFEAVQAFQTAMGATEGKNGATASSITALMMHLKFQGKTLDAWRTEQDVSRTQTVYDPATGSAKTDYHGRPVTEYKFPAMQYVTAWRLSKSGDKRWETNSLNSASEFSLFRNMLPQKLEKEVAFIIQDRKMKNGGIKVVGRTDILREISKKILAETLQSDCRIFLVASKSAIDQLAQLHHYPADKLRIYKESDYEYAYVPKKAQRGQVKLWMATPGSFTETKVDLSTLDDTQYYVKAEGQVFCSETLRGKLDLKDICQLLAEVTPNKELYLFRKTVWDKIPEDWVEVDLNMVKKFIKDSPHLYIDLNRRILAQTASGSRPDLSRMRVKAVVTFNNKICRDGFVDFLRNTNIPDPRGVNYEDNMAMFRDLFGRPQIIFADVYIRDARYSMTLLERLRDVLPIDDRLTRAISNTIVRAKANWERARKIGKEKNKLLSWVDWTKVSLREVAEHFGYTVTPYVEK